MRNVKLLAAAALAVSLLAPQAAHAVTFTESFSPFYPSGTDVMGKGGKIDRFHVGAFAAFWDFPNPAFDVDTPSPLFTLEYFINSQFSVGGWYSRQTGDFNAVGLHGDFDSDVFELFVAYHLPDKPLTRGVSIQLGYSADLTDIDIAGRSISADSKSVDFWLNKAQRITYLNKAKKTMPFTIFGGIGYYPDGEGSWHGGSINVGASIGITDVISLTGSYWWINLFDQDAGTDTITRWTIGLSGHF